MDKDSVQTFYPIFQDVHVMIFIGFGFLMVFLKTHSWTSVGYNFLIASWALQITILISPFWHDVLNGSFHMIELDIPKLIIGDFGAGAVLITFGAILGKCSLMQLWVLATIEIIFYGLNEAICAGKLGAVDMGGSMYVHTFGAFFGLGASFFFSPKKSINDAKTAASAEGNYISQLVAMVGTIYLWMFWPSFNGALATGSQQQRVMINTVLSISASCITACGFARLQLGKLDMEVVLNATLAGGVAIGTPCDLITNPGVAIAVGASAGIVSAWGFLKLNGFLKEKIGLHDTCGVLNLHGIPGIMGGIYGCIAVAMAGEAFGDQAAIESTFAMVAEGRTLSKQS
jgi:ammonium transporter Rh